MSYKEILTARSSPTRRPYNTTSSQFRPSTQYHVSSGRKKISQEPWNIYKRYSNSIKVMVKSGAAWVATSISWTEAIPLTTSRPLLPHDGGSSASLCSVSAGSVPPARPQSKFFSAMLLFFRLTFPRNQNCGTGSAYYMIVMAPLSMPKRPFPRSCICSQTSRKQMRSTSVLG